MQIVNKAI